jgi:hypothetical protein
MSFILHCGITGTRHYDIMTRNYDYAALEPGGKMANYSKLRHYD